MQIDFHEEQQYIINEHKNNILLQAPAGTGKTNTLAYRIASVLAWEKDVEPDNILCITFTNKAANELAGRIAGVSGKTGEMITVKTIHGFCYQVLSAEAKKKTDIFQDFTIFDEEDCKQIIKQLKLPAGDHIYAANQFIYQVKHSRADYNLFTDNIKEDYKHVIEKLYKEKTDLMNRICSNKNHTINQELLAYFLYDGHEVVFSYDQLLRNAHGLDFIDLIVETYRLFQNRRTRESWQKQYSYINIDEVQDTSYLEYQVLSSLFPGNNILLCGDVNQTIYQWRGSDPQKIYREFCEKYDPVKVSFVHNFRSVPELIFLGNTIRQKLLGEENVATDLENSNTCEAFSIFAAEGIGEEVRHIIQAMKALKAQGITDFCILTRANAYNKDICNTVETLKKQGESVPFTFMVANEFQFFKRAEIKDIMAFLKLLVNPGDTSSFIRIISQYVKGVGEKTIAALTGGKFHQAGLRLPDMLLQSTYRYGEPYGLLLDAWEKENVIVFDVETTGVDTLQDDIIQIAAVKLNKKGEVTDRFVHFLHTEKDLAPTEHVHGFTNEWLKAHGHPAKDVLTEFKDFTRDALLVGHNVTFDIGMVTNQMAREEIDGWPYIGMNDTLEIYRRYYPGLPQYTLGYLSQHFPVEAKPDHNALNDILATAELLTMVVFDRLIPTREERKKEMASYLAPFQKIHDFWRQLYEQSKFLLPSQLVTVVIERLGLEERFKRSGETDRLYNVRQLVELFCELETAYRNCREALLEMVKLSALSNSEVDLLFKKRKKIPVLTVHQAKGMEFDAVFLAGMMDDIFPTYMAHRSGNLEEEKRLFYVAATRAKKQLHISYATHYNGRDRTMSRFLQPLK